MQELRANTQVKVVIGPAVAVGDAFTPVTTLDLSTADEAEILKHDAAAVTSIAAATFAAITSADGYYNLTLTTSLTDTEGLLIVLINDDSLILPIKHTFMVLSEAAWDSKYLAKDDGWMDVNIKTVGRADNQETEASNLEAACAAYSATRGLSGTALPAAAADAAGGLIISDAGGLDADNRMPAAAAVTNLNTVFNTDFATNYSTTTDKWQVEANVLQIEGSDATNQIRDAVVDDATRIDASALNTASGAVGSNGSGLTEAGGTGDHLTAVPWNASWDAEVQSEVEDGLVAHRLDELLNADSDIDGAAPPTVGSVFHELMSKTAGSFTFDQTTDSLEALRDRGDAAWITASGFSTHSAADVWAAATRTLTAGTNIVLAKGTGVTGFNDLSEAQVNAEADTALSDVGVTLARMGALTDWIDGGRLDLLIDAVKAKTDNLPSDPADASDVAAAFSTVNSTLATIAGYIDTEIGTLQTSVNDVPTNAELATALAAADDAVLAAIAALNNLSAAQVNAEVLDVLATDTFAEAAAVPAATSSLKDKINWLFALARNKLTQTSTTQTLRNDADNASIATSTVSDDGTTTTRGEWS